jgi:AcrR family transcriptional regulator
MAGRRNRPRRRSADERRELVLEAAREEFAAFGLSGATGEAISYRAGISHPYLLRLFGSKKELFLAVMERTFDELMAAVGDAGGQGGGNSLSALDEALHTQLGEKDGFLALLQFHAAGGDDHVRMALRRRMAELHEYLRRASGASEEEVAELFAGVMLRASAAAMRLPDIAGREPWARGLLRPSGQ